MYRIAALYHFTRFDDPAALQGPLQALCEAERISGSLLLAREGINGTIAGPQAGIAMVLAHIRTLPGCADLEWKDSQSAEQPFRRMKVRLKKEIVTMGQPDVDPRARVGHYVEPSEWNALIQSPDVAVIDTRNDYEVAIGTFEGAVNPETPTFRDFPAWWEANRHRFHNKRIAMFCTGGIRCEKSTNYLVGQGVEDVYHLKGGILKYLEEVPEDKARGRVSVSCLMAESRWATGCARGRTVFAMPAAARSCPRTCATPTMKRVCPATSARRKHRRPTRPGFASAKNRWPWPRRAANAISRSFTKSDHI